MIYSCYVYYRVAASCADDAAAAARGRAEALQESTGVSARLMKKVGESLLWMEVYDGILETELFLSSMQVSLEQAGLNNYLQAGSERHIEMFQCA